MLREKQSTFVSQLFASKPSADFPPDQSGNVAIVFALMATAADVGRRRGCRRRSLAACAGPNGCCGRCSPSCRRTSASDRWQDQGARLRLPNNSTLRIPQRRLPVVSDTISFAVGNDGISMVANGTAYIQTPFLQIASIDRLPLVAEGQQPIARAQLAVTGGNDSQIQSLEISVMLDVTGSMAGQKLQDLKDSATDLINIVLLNGLNNLPVKVGIVPFSEDIRLPNTAALNKARGTSNLPSTKSITTGSGRSQTTTTVLSLRLRGRACRQPEVHGRSARRGPVRHGALHHVVFRRQGQVHRPEHGRDCTVDQRQELTPYDRIEPEGGRRHGRPPRHGLGLVPVVAELGVPLAIEHARALRPHRKEDRDPDDRWRVQHAVRLERHLGEPEQLSHLLERRERLLDDAGARAVRGHEAAGHQQSTQSGSSSGGNQTAIDTLSQCATAPAKPTDPVQFYNVTSGVQLQQAFHDIALKLTSLHLSM